MSDEVRAHLFEPFFTTKESGRGTGLAAVYGLVKQGEGHVEVESAPGQGSAFFLAFPALEELPLQAPPPDSPGGSEIVLLVEDEGMVRDLARRALVQSGYTVMEAADGRQALAVSRRHAGPVHLLLTDVLMPHLSGPDLARQLTAERPGLKVLYVSGYTDDAFAAHGGSQAGLPYLQKPFTPQALARKVREVLDG
jgi:CheY-like chemotaxis protein